MESIINQLFWLWVPFMMVPEWLRIGLILFIVIMLLRPLLLKWIPSLCSFLLKFLQKVFYWFTYPFMAFISYVQDKRVAKGKADTPFWVDGIEWIFSIIQKTLDTLLKWSNKRVKNEKKVKKWTRGIALLFTVLMTAAILNNPEESYAQKWYAFESWVTEDKVVKELGFDTGNLSWGSSNRAQEVSVRGSERTEFVLKESYRNGGNLRDTPSLNGKVIGDITGNQVVTYLHESEVDKDHRTWYKVEREDGLVGWVSERIVEQY
ncbi:hypothetical protein BTR23_04100 [Alkalihalophilus pseudofirmus]|nr:hypothetical protein BTR23_04100 [Alkalihalophilus pseudofirmus]